MIGKNSTAYHRNAPLGPKGQGATGTIRQPLSADSVRPFVPGNSAGTPGGQPVVQSFFPFTVARG